MYSYPPRPGRNSRDVRRDAATLSSNTNVAYFASSHAPAAQDSHTVNHKTIRASRVALARAPLLLLPRLPREAPQKVQRPLRTRARVAAREPRPASRSIEVPRVALALLRRDREGLRRGRRVGRELRVTRQPASEAQGRRGRPRLQGPLLRSLEQLAALVVWLVRLPLRSVLGASARVRSHR